MAQQTGDAARDLPPATLGWSGALVRASPESARCCGSLSGAARTMRHQAAFTAKLCPKAWCLRHTRIAAVMRETELVRAHQSLGAAKPIAARLLYGRHWRRLRCVSAQAEYEELVFTTDFTIEDRHFTLDTHSAADVGHKALARSLSDLAAMGANPYSVWSRSHFLPK